METTQKTKIIAIANQKGGVGKTTTAVNLGAALSEAGYSILLIDLDPQSSLSISLGFDVLDLKETLYDVLLETKPNMKLDQIIKKTKYPNIDLVPSNIELSRAEMELITEMNREQALANAINGISKKYDYIMIDCPPSLGLLTTNALAAAQQVLIPIESDYLAMRGASLLLDTISKVKRKLNADLALLGVLINMYEQVTLHSREILEEIQEAFGDKVFKSIIRRSVRVKEAPVEGQSLLSYEPNSPISQAYRELAKEIINHG